MLGDLGGHRDMGLSFGSDAGRKWREVPEAGGMNEANIMIGQEATSALSQDVWSF